MVTTFSMSKSSNAEFTGDPSQTTPYHCFIQCFLCLYRGLTRVLSSQDDMYEEGTSGRCMTLMDRIKMGKRNPSQQPAAGKTDADGESRPPPSKDHDAYVKKTNAKQAYLPLPVRMKVSCNNLSGWKGLAAESNGKGVTRVEEMCRWKVPGPTGAYKPKILKSVVV